jgi:hypothetical protein
MLINKNNFLHIFHHFYRQFFMTVLYLLSLMNLRLGRERDKMLTAVMLCLVGAHGRQMLPLHPQVSLVLSQRQKVFGRTTKISLMNCLKFII